MEGNKEDRAKFFPVGCSEQARGNGHKLKYRKNLVYSKGD